MVMYTDRSQETDQTGTPIRVKALWVINTGRRWLGKNGIALGNNTEVYNSETIAIYKGLETTLAIPQTQNAHTIHISLDNLSMAQNVGLVPNSSGKGKL